MLSKPVDQGGPRTYEIRVEGGLGADWSEWFGGLAVTTDAEGHTVLAGPIADQAALYGVLVRLRDLGLPLISVNTIESSYRVKGNVPYV